MLGLILRYSSSLPVIIPVIYTITLTLSLGHPGNPLEKPEGRQPAEVIEAMSASTSSTASPPSTHLLPHHQRHRARPGDLLSGSAREREQPRPPARPTTAASTRPLAPVQRLERQRDGPPLPVSVVLGLTAILIAPS